jgi:hypothetical protein
VFLTVSHVERDDFEDDTPEILAEAMAVLEAGLSKWFEEQGIELD